MDRILINECIITEEQFEFENAYKEITRLKPFFQETCNIDLSNYKYHLAIIDNVNFQSSLMPIFEIHKPRRIISLIKNEQKFLQEIKDSLITCFPEFSSFQNVIEKAHTNYNAALLLLFETYKTTQHHLSG